MNLPNKLTLVRIGMIPVFVALMMIDGPLWQLLAAVVFIAAALTDLMDGYLARKYNMVTDFGKFMDPIADKLLVVAAMILLVEQHRMPGWVAIVFVAREFVISGFRLVAASGGKVLAAGKLGKYKTATQMTAVVLLILCAPMEGSVHAPLLGAFGLVAANALLYVSLVLAIWSAAEYIRDNRGVIGTDK